jgi:hypothetical protein
MTPNACDGINRKKGVEMEVKEQEGQTLVININLSRGLVLLLTLVLLGAAFLGYLALGREQASASGLEAPLAASSGMRQYYLTQTYHNGGEADGTDGDGAGVCQPGYHFASVWEILDTSGLKYNTTLGSTRADSGHGPPSGVPLAGWVRTGNYSSGDPRPGEGNCHNWSSSSVSDSGTIAALPPTWDTGSQDLLGWNGGTEPCDSTIRVWCVED